MYVYNRENALKENLWSKNTSRLFKISKYREEKMFCRYLERA